MRALSDSRRLRYLVFGGLYFGQGVPWGFIGTAYVLFLTDLGLSGTQIGGALAMAYLPWSFKVVWGPLLDFVPRSRFGRRRPFIIAAQLLMGATLLLLVGLDARSELTLLSALLFLHNTFASLQDVAVDALAVELLPPEERARGNSVMWAAKVGGIAIGGYGGTRFAAHFGWPALFVALALIVWAVMLLPLLVEEGTPAVPGSLPEGRPSVKELLRSFAFPAPLLGLLIYFLTPFGYALLMATKDPALRNLVGLSSEQVARLSALVDPLAGVVGALAGGLVADRFGSRKTMAVAMGVMALALAGFGLLPSLWSSMTFLTAWHAIYFFAMRAYATASFGLGMTLSNPRVGATQFAVYMGATNLAYVYAAKLGGTLGDRFGFRNLVLLAAGVQAVTILLLPLVNPKSAEQRFRGTF
jgi:MFS transporter, PAT family, beta-lactamase induction signal transducer AmpG